MSSFRILIAGKVFQASQMCESNKCEQRAVGVN